MSEINCHLKKEFDLVISLGVLHNLYLYELKKYFLILMKLQHLNISWLKVIEIIKSLQIYNAGLLHVILFYT